MYSKLLNTIKDKALKDKLLGLLRDRPAYHYFYNEAREEKELFNEVLSNAYPKRIIDVFRPNEDTKHKEYRRNTFENTALGDFKKVITTLKKVQRSEDWSVIFNEEDKKSIELKSYTSQDLPVFQSVENWMFNYALKEMVTDPNALVLVQPFDIINDPKKNPYPYVYSSDCVIYFDSELLFVQPNEQSYVATNNSLVATGNVYLFVTKNEYVYIYQTGKEDSNTYRVITITHESGEIPAFKLGGVVKKKHRDNILYESIINPCLPFWREALRRYSDHQVNITSHVHPEKWQYQNTVCPTCKGKKTIHNHVNKKSENCQTCGGLGYIHNTSPFGVVSIAPERASVGDDSKPPPTPPMGYVTKPTENVQFIKDDYIQNLHFALRAINLEFLSQTPMQQSGIAKAFDRDEINTFMYDVATLVVTVMKKVYLHIGGFLFLGLPFETIRNTVPQISIPTKYDVLSTQILKEKAISLQEANAPTMVIHKAWIEYYSKEYGSNSIEYSLYKDSIKLDPLLGLKVEQKEVVFLSGGCTKEDYMLSSKITSYLHRAYFEKDKYNELPYNKKKDILLSYVIEDVQTQNRLKIGEETTTTQ